MGVLYKMTRKSNHGTNPILGHIILAYFGDCGPGFGPRVRHAGAKMEAMLVGNFMEKRGDFSWGHGPWFSESHPHFYMFLYVQSERGGQ